MSSSSSKKARRPRYNNLQFLFLLGVLCVAVLRSIVHSSVFFCYSSSYYCSPPVATTTATPVLLEEPPIRRAEDADDARRTELENDDDDDDDEDKVDDSLLPKENNNDRIATSPRLTAHQSSPPQEHPAEPEKEEEPTGDDDNDDEAESLSREEEPEDDPVVDLIQSEAQTNTTTNTTIPRTIYMYWEKGFPIAHLPGLQMTLRSWIYFNPGWEVRALNGKEADELSERSRYISDDIWSKMTVQAKSDVYRTLLLYKHGGVWVDASLYCNTPLDKWLPLSNITDLYSFRRTNNPSEQKELGISPWITSWFLASPPRSYTLTKIVEMLSNPDEQHRMLDTDPKKNKDGKYFWWHHLVADVANSDEQVRARIESFRAPFDCGQKNWMSTAPILKRCANHLMFHMLATTQQCCDSGSSSGSSGGSNATTTNNMSQEWQDVCSEWNCTMTTANLVPFNEKVKDLYGGGQVGVHRIKEEWYKELELPDISKEAYLKDANPLAAMAPVARGTAQVRPALINSTASTNIPRIIWMFWDTGWPANNHPGTNMNKRSWELLNPTFTVHALDGPMAERLTNRSAHVPDERWHVLHVQAKSDIYRTLLLYKYGGIWADCNVFCNRPVDEWVDLNSTDVVSMRRTDNLQEQEEKGISPWITSWFLAAPKASYTISKVVDVISNPDEHYRFRAQYFWWHHIVSQVANNDTRIHAMMQNNYSSPWVCGGRRWQHEAAVLKRCATPKMYPIIYTSEQCCPEMGGRPHFDINNMTGDDNVKNKDAWTTLCSQWNCTAQAANMVHGKVIRELWGKDFLNTLQSDYYDP